MPRSSRMAEPSVNATQHSVRTETTAKVVAEQICLDEAKKENLDIRDHNP